MRKRKVNPSLESEEEASNGGLVTEVSTETAPREVAVIASQPTGSQPTSEVWDQGQRSHDADVPSTHSPRPPRIEEGRAELLPEVAEGLEVRTEAGLPEQDRVLADQLREEEADVAGEHVPSRHWFWEMLEEAGYDVW